MKTITSSLLVSACLLMPVGAYALDINVGGEKGVSVSVDAKDGLDAGASVGGRDGVNAGASVGGRSSGGLGADVSASVGGRDGVNADVGATVGGRDLASANAKASVGGDRGLKANVGLNAGTGGVNLGVGLGLGGTTTTTPGTPGNPGVNTPGTKNPALRRAIVGYNNMSRPEQIRLARRCVDILGSGGYDAALTQLCRMIQMASR
jgi:hypothetical protein